MTEAAMEEIDKRMSAVDPLGLSLIFAEYHDLDQN